MMFVGGRGSSETEQSPEVGQRDPCPRPLVSIRRPITSGPPPTHPVGPAPPPTPVADHCPRPRRGDHPTPAATVSSDPHSLSAGEIRCPDTVSTINRQSLSKLNAALHTWVLICAVAAHVAAQTRP